LDITARAVLSAAYTHTHRHTNPLTTWVGFDITACVVSSAAYTHTQTHTHTH